MIELILPSQRGALIVLILTAIILASVTTILWLLVKNRNELKAFVQDFPTLGGTVVVAIVLIFFTGLAVIVRLALGQKFPDGYETWIWALMALAGVTTGGMIGKRATDFRFKQAGASPVNVEAPSTVVVNPNTPTEEEVVG